jgi:hypothetical protein
VTDQPTLPVVDNPPVVAQEYPVMLDAAFPQDLDGTHATAVAGYLRSPMATNGWDKAAWRGIPGPKLPIWVAGEGGRPDAEGALTQLGALGVPTGSVVAVDMENRVDITYINNFFSILHLHRYKVWVYGSAESVFHMPACNGYWVADYAGIGAFMYAHKTVRATQWTNGPLYDTSTVMQWALRQFWR